MLWGRWRLALRVHRCSYLYVLPFIPFHTYSVAVYADYTNAATENDETNNARMESITY